jgi:hypothetical protein
MSSSGNGTELDGYRPTPIHEDAMNNDRSSEDRVGRADHNLAGAAEAARDPQKSGRELEQADDRGGSRDGERLDAGDPGDREQLDYDGGRPQSSR